jgi:hypothetical protein
VLASNGLKLTAVPYDTDECDTDHPAPAPGGVIPIGASNKVQSANEENLTFRE